jgi:hypothetical protein
MRYLPAKAFHDLPDGIELSGSPDDYRFPRFQLVGVLAASTARHRAEAEELLARFTDACQQAGRWRAIDMHMFEMAIREEQKTVIQYDRIVYGNEKARYDYDRAITAHEERLIAWAQRTSTLFGRRNAGAQPVRPAFPELQPVLERDDIYTMGDVFPGWLRDALNGLLAGGYMELRTTDDGLPLAWLTPKAIEALDASNYRVRQDA